MRTAAEMRGVKRKDILQFTKDAERSIMRAALRGHLEVRMPEMDSKYPQIWTAGPQDSVWRDLRAELQKFGYRVTFKNFTEISWANEKD